MDIDEEAGEATLADGRCGALCAVCGDEASGHFFGAKVCLPCKSFFIRCNRAGPPSILQQCRGTCDVTKQLRNRCQYCRLQRCLASGMARRDKPEVVRASLGQELCRVCGDLANGLHFGVFTCEGCKKFFRRALKEHASYVCRIGGRCPINPRTRNHCRHCRYRRCLDTGMSRTAIKMGRPRKVPSRSASDSKGLIRAALLDNTKPRTTPTGEVSFGVQHTPHWTLHPEDPTHQTEVPPPSATWADPISPSMASLDRTMSGFLESVSDYRILFDTLAKAELDLDYGMCVKQAETSRNEGSANSKEVPMDFPPAPRKMQRQQHADEEAFSVAATLPICKQLSNQNLAWSCGDNCPETRCALAMETLRPDLRKVEPHCLSSKSVSPEPGGHFQVAMSSKLGQSIRDSSDFRPSHGAGIDSSHSSIEKSRQQRCYSNQRWSGTATFNESRPDLSPFCCSVNLNDHAKDLNQAAADLVSFNPVTSNAPKPEEILGTTSSVFTPAQSMVSRRTNSCATSSGRVQAAILEELGPCEFASTRPVTEEDRLAFGGTSSAGRSDPQHKISAGNRIEVSTRQRTCLESKQGGVPSETETAGNDLTSAEAGGSRHVFVLSCAILSSDDSSVKQSPGRPSPALDQPVNRSTTASLDKDDEDSDTAFPPMAGAPASNAAEAVNYSPFTRQEEMRQTSDHFHSLNLLLEQAEEAVDETVWKTYVFSETPCEARQVEELMSRHYNFSPVSIVSYWSQLADRLPATLSFGTTMPSRHRTILDSLLRAYQDVISVMDHSKYEPKTEGAMLWPINGLELKRVWAIVQNRIIRGVAASMACAYLVPGMERVHPNDRTHLVNKEFCFAMTVLNSTQYFDRQRGQFRNFFTFDMTNIPPVHAFRTRLLNLGRKISQAAPDVVELGLLFALNTVCLEADGFEDEDSLLAVRQDLLMTFASYLACERRVEPRQRMRSLFRLMPRLRVIGRWNCHLTRNMVFDSSLLASRMRTLHLHKPTDPAPVSAACPIPAK